MVIRGHVWKFGDNVNTDNIIPGRYKFKTQNLNELVQYVLIDLNPEFAKKVRKGDVIVAGRNFGYGSSREHAPRLLKLAGVGAVVAKSFARIFFRNAINIGLPVIIAPEVYDKTDEGDIMEVDLEKGIIKNLSKNLTFKFKPYPKEIMKIVLEGGVIEYYRKHGVFPWEESTE
ncbi:MAG: 3-isopropylmalate dehydratase [Desulfurococcales archaeon ex4484_217_2]|nr:MAG: 3-isopropylmalate dehydratase [Desulfurococcales archaeon ex4484_217_2]